MYVVLKRPLCVGIPPCVIHKYQSSQLLLSFVSIALMWHLSHSISHHPITPILSHPTSPSSISYFSHFPLSSFHLLFNVLHETLKHAGEEMIRILKHDDYKYPLEKSKKTLDTPRPSPVLLDIIEEQELEAARELIEREAEATLMATVSASADDESDRCVSFIVSYHWFSGYFMFHFINFVRRSSFLVTSTLKF